MKRSITVMRLWALVLLTVGSVPSPGTQGAAAPAAFVEVVSATEQVERGRSIFEMICSRCHGPQGQGTDDGPQIIANPHPLKGHKTAQALFDFVSTEMPHDAPGSLQSQEYWDVLAFILDANKLLPENTTLGPDNAANIKVGD